MRQRGSKSAASHSIVPIVAPLGYPRPEPPSELSEDEATEWRAIVDAVPTDWVKHEQHPLLVNYCRHVV
jgi:hypothetical protein